jgi:hypothetical protein
VRPEGRSRRRHGGARGEGRGGKRHDKINRRTIAGESEHEEDSQALFYLVLFQILLEPNASPKQGIMYSVEWGFPNIFLANRVSVFILLTFVSFSRTLTCYPPRK